MERKMEGVGWEGWEEERHGGRERDRQTGQAGRQTMQREGKLEELDPSLYHVVSRTGLGV